MQENEFEKQVRKQMEEFALIPNAEVWKLVEKNIRKEKRRRVLFYWMFAGFLLAGAAGTLLLFNNQKNSHLTNLSSSNKPVDDKSAEMSTVKKKDENAVAEKALIKEDDKSPAEKLQTSVGKGTKVVNKKTYSSKKILRKEELLVQVKRKTSNAFNNASETSNHNEPGEYSRVGSSSFQTRMEGRKELPPHKYFLSQQGVKLQQDSLPISTATSEHKKVIPDTLSLEKKEESIKRKNQSSSSGKLHIGFTLFGGLSDNVTGIGFGSEKSLATADRSSALSSQSSPSVSGVSYASALMYESSTSFGAGLYVQKALTKKVSVSAGVDYHYMSTKSAVGNKIDSTLNIYDSVLQLPTIVNSFYRGGLTTSYSNKYHLIQFPINLQVRLNKSTAYPFLFSFGLSPSLLIASNALYLNNNAAAYYQEENQFDKFMLFGQSELLFTVSNKRKYQLSLGPALQYDFNSFSKTATHTSQHLIFTGIKTNITLK